MFFVMIKNNGPFLPGWQCNGYISRLLWQPWSFETTSINCFISGIVNAPFVLVTKEITVSTFLSSEMRAARKIRRVWHFHDVNDRSGIFVISHFREQWNSTPHSCRCYQQNLDLMPGRLIVLPHQFIEQTVKKKKKTKLLCRTLSALQGVWMNDQMFLRGQDPKHRSLP